MNTESSKLPSSPRPAPAPADSALGSGEGASTALEALIRKRKLAETPDRSDPPSAPP
ncbi:MAG: hypothetical protein JWQ76_3524 [Ramlibacter sp.]|nr:hypothetical protein [Ramlibacter sp.]